MCEFSSKAFIFIREIGILECVFGNFWGTLENENSRSKPPQKNLTNFLYHGPAANTHTHTFTHTSLASHVGSQRSEPGVYPSQIYSRPLAL